MLIKFSKIIYLFILLAQICSIAGRGHRANLALEVDEAGNVTMFNNLSWCASFVPHLLPLFDTNLLKSPAVYPSYVLATFVYALTRDPGDWKIFWTAKNSLTSLT